MRHLDSADYSSIQLEIDRITGKRNVDNGMAVDFCKELTNLSNPRYVLKQIRFNKLGMALVSFLIDRVTGITEPIEVYNSDNTARLSIIIVDSPKEKDFSHKPVYVREVSTILDKFVVIAYFESMDDKAGKKLLESVLNILKDVPVVVQAGYLYYGDEKSLEECNDLIYNLQDLRNLYSDFGFRNINQYVGNYQYGSVMINCSDYDFDKIVGIDQPKSFYESVMNQNKDNKFKASQTMSGD